MSKIILKLVLCAGVALLAGCAPQQTVKKVPVSDELSYDDAINALASNITVQLQPGDQNILDRARSALATPTTTVISMDTVVDAQNGYAMTFGQKLQHDLATRLGTLLKNTQLVPLTKASIAKSAYVMSGSVGFEDRPSGDAKSYRINVSVTDTKTGIVAAQSSVWLKDKNLDMSPVSVYQDSPVFLNDHYNDGLIATTRTPAGKPADKTYFNQFAVAALVAEAQEAYSGNDAKKALSLYQQAESMPDGKLLKVYTGMYVSYLKAGDLAGAENTFGQLVSVALAENNLSIRFLFAVNSTEFITDPRFTQQYRIWTKQLGKQLSGGKACLDVIGHCSKTGSEAYNQRLSLQRAETVRALMQKDSAESASMTRAVGKGYSENLVGSGTDDERDAIDRRVEFKVIQCNDLK
jgi:outer membrane protein OmpA-like peptidoglycan-associated protein